MTDRERAKSLLVALVDCAGEPGLLRTNVYKGYYCALLLYMHHAGAELLAWPVVKMPNGPGVESGPRLLDELCAEGTLEMAEKMVGPQVGLNYTIRSKDRVAQRLTEFDEVQRKAIAEACELVRDESAANLTRVTHEMSRAWRAASMGHPLSLYGDLTLDDEAVGAQVDELKDAEHHLRDIFG